MRYAIRTILFTGLLLGAGSSTMAQPGLDSFFMTADAFLKAQVTDGAVHYNAIEEQPQKLNQLVTLIGTISLGNASEAERKAFYINAYNLLVIHVIVEAGIPSSPMDVEGFFDSITHTVAGKQMTLDDIEKGTLFARFPDARLHFALVCAARGCPPLQPEAYRAGQLDSQLDHAAEAALNSDEFIRSNDEEQRIAISEIFKWYKQDFLAASVSIRAYINRYRMPAIPADYSIGYYPYDWSLNSAH